MNNALVPDEATCVVVGVEVTNKYCSSLSYATWEIITVSEALVVPMEVLVVAEVCGAYLGL